VALLNKGLVPSDSVAEPVSPLFRTQIVGDISIVGGPPVADEDGGIPSVPEYEILESLGEGGMGIVYKARQTGLNRMVALKMIAAEHVSGAQRRRFKVEAESTGRLQHPNIVQVFAIGEHEGRPFLAMELVEGGTLANLFAAGPLPVREAAQLIAAMAHGVHHAHQRGVIHRDLKPGNVLIKNGPNGRLPKIADFGLAKVLDADDTTKTRTGTILGTPNYMAPEQAAGKKTEIGPAADVWALGVMLYESLTGRLPFRGDTAWDTLCQVAQLDPVPPSRIRPQLSRDLDTICLKALSKKPTDRYASAEALAQDLDRFAAGEAIAARPEHRLRKAIRRLRQRPLMMASLVLLVGLGFLGGLHLVQNREIGWAALAEARELNSTGAFDHAIMRCDQGLARVGNIPVSNDLVALLIDQRETSVALARVKTLGQFVESLRFQFDGESMSRVQRRELADNCLRLWNERDKLGGAPHQLLPSIKQQLKADCLDLALIGSSLRMRDAQTDDERMAALTWLDEAERECGSTPALTWARHQIRKSLGQIEGEPEALNPSNATEFHLLGRAMLQNAKPQEAAPALRQAVDLSPKAILPHFDLGRCALQLDQYEEAIRSFTACLSMTRSDGPNNEDVLYYNRGLAWMRRAKEFPSSESTLALADFGRALERNPRRSEAFLNRGLVRWKCQDFDGAVKDLSTALELGYSPLIARLNLARVCFDAGRFVEAENHAEAVIVIDRNHEGAKLILERALMKINPATPNTR
jgi:tetratricopeptide (TPR) repeat protein/tRNA A-37 threonylcarbamoyl transferase component Bud32